jgi:predicted DNA-binding protein with PD1-like motif
MATDSIKIHPLRLKPGQDLKKGIEEWVKKENIESGWIVTCVGSLKHASIRYANKPGADTLEGLFEIVSLTGTISVSGLHLHISVSDSTGKTIGGHLMDGCIVYTTAELVLGSSDQFVFSREKDGTTPWKELQIRSK